MRILFVCLGNICRSPLAEGIMRFKVEEKNLPWEIDSAGTSGWHIGEAPDPRSVEVANRNGIDIRSQQARRFTGYDLETFDLIFAMDNSNLREILHLANSDNEKQKVDLIMNTVDPGKNVAVPDPYYGEHGFEKVFEMLNKACDKIIEQYA